MLQTKHRPVAQVLPIFRRITLYKARGSLAVTFFFCLPAVSFFGKLTVLIILISTLVDQKCISRCRNDPRNNREAFDEHVDVMGIENGNECWCGSARDLRSGYSDRLQRHGHGTCTEDCTYITGIDKYYYCGTFNALSAAPTSQFVPSRVLPLQLHTSHASCREKAGVCPSKLFIELQRPGPLVGGEMVRRKTNTSAFL